MVDVKDIPASFINSQFIAKIEQGMTKEAAVSATSFVRDKLREDAFVRKIFTPMTITDSELNPNLDDDKPMKILEKEPDTTAMHVSFRGMPESEYFTGERYAVKFGKMVSKKMTKSIFELKTYQNDIRQILMDNAAKELGRQEDEGFIATVNTACVANTAEQDLEIGGGFTPVTYAEALKSLEYMAKVKPLGCVLMNSAMGKEFLKWPATSIGDTVASDQYLKGVTTGTVYGIKTIFTIKRDLVPDNVIYLFATEDFIGKFFILQDATVYIKNEADMLEFFSYSSIGIGIGNSNSFVRCTFVED